MFENVGVVVLTSLEGGEDFSNAADREEPHDSFLLLGLFVNNLLRKSSSLNDVTDSVVLVSLHLHHERNCRV